MKNHKLTDKTWIQKVKPMQIFQSYNANFSILY